VAGGFGGVEGVDPKLEIYNPHTDRWSTGASMPAPYGAPGSAVLDDKLYSVGGCWAQSCDGSTDVEVYDPASNSWHMAASYPEPITWASCGAVAGKLYCAGGDSATGIVQHAYVYDPATDAWSPIADMPTPTWGAASSAANGSLIVSGGVVGEAGVQAELTNQTYAYSPATNTWNALPNANAAQYRGAGAAGFYVAGGIASGKFLAPSISNVSLLPGYSQDASPNDVTWLSESAKSVTLEPGQSTTVTVAASAAVPGIVAQRDYTASLSVSGNTPYPALSVPVTMHVGPGKDWGRVAGTVFGWDSHGNRVPLAGAMVEVRAGDDHYTLTTTKEGTYSLWLPVGDRPVIASVSDSGFGSATEILNVRKDQTTTHDFTLRPAS
jgi:hypothetical protein